MGQMQQGLSPQIQQKRPHHTSMARAMVAGGMTPGELALAFGYTPGQISRIIQTPFFQMEVERLQGIADEGVADLQENICAMAVRALEVLDEDMEIEPTSIAARNVRQRAALSVVDRFLVKKEKPTLPGGNGNTYNIQQNIYGMPIEDVQSEVLEMISEDFIED